MTSCVLCRNEKSKYSIIIKRNQKYQNWFLLKRNPDDIIKEKRWRSHIVKDLSFQEDYYHVLEQIIDFMIEDAKDKAIPAIECYALAKGVSDCETAIEMIRDPENITMVSEYYPWLKKIGAFLKDNPEETKRIEEYAQVKNLEKFFE